MATAIRAMRESECWQKYIYNSNSEDAGLFGMQSKGTEPGFGLRARVPTVYRFVDGRENHHSDERGSAKWSAL